MHTLTPLTLSATKVIEEVAAVAEKYLQKSERKKLMPPSKYEVGTRELLVHGNMYLSNLINQNYLLYPMAIASNG